MRFIQRTQNDDCGTRARRQNAATDKPLVSCCATIPRHRSRADCNLFMTPSMPRCPRRAKTGFIQRTPDNCLVAPVRETQTWPWRTQPCRGWLATAPARRRPTLPSAQFAASDCCAGCSGTTTALPERRATPPHMGPGAALLPRARGTITAVEPCAADDPPHRRPSSRATVISVSSYH